MQDGNKRSREVFGGERGNSCVADCEVRGGETKGISQAGSQLAQSAASTTCPE